MCMTLKIPLGSGFVPSSDRRFPGMELSVLAGTERMMACGFIPIPPGMPLNGIFLEDFLVECPSDPKAFGTSYLTRSQQLIRFSYPPFFYLLEAGLFAACRALPLLGQGPGTPVHLDRHAVSLGLAEALGRRRRRGTRPRWCHCCQRLQPGRMRSCWKRSRPRRCAGRGCSTRGAARGAERSASRPGLAPVYAGGAYLLPVPGRRPHHRGLGPRPRTLARS